jgi:hypothetical protein
MANIKLAFEEIPCQIYKNIPVTNWRMLIPDTEKLELDVTIARIESFRIFNITVEEFLANIRDGRDFTKKFEYKSNPIVCSICYGRGWVDWVQKARNSPGSVVYDTFKRYRRNKKVIYDYRTHLTPFSALVSVPYLKKGQEICKRCKGSGLDIMNIFADENSCTIYNPKMRC